MYSRTFGGLTDEELREIVGSMYKVDNEFIDYVTFLKGVVGFKYRKGVIKSFSHVMHKLKDRVYAFYEYLSFLKGDKGYSRRVASAHIDFIKFLKLYKPELVKVYDVKYRLYKSRLVDREVV